MPDYDIQSNRRRVEAIDLQPYGNTISVETPSDNPFEDAQDIEVFTQTNTGFGGPAPAHMRSKRIITNPASVSPMWAGRVAAAKMRAPAHRPHAGFAPGINGLGLGAEAQGAGAVGTGQPSTLTQSLQLAQAGIQAAGTTAQQIFAQRQAKADADRAAAEARTAEAITARQSMMAPVNAMTSRPALSGSMIGIAAVAGVIALVMFMRKK